MPVWCKVSDVIRFGSKCEKKSRMHTQTWSILRHMIQLSCGELWSIKNAVWSYKCLARCSVPYGYLICNPDCGVQLKVMSFKGDHGHGFSIKATREHQSIQGQNTLICWRSILTPLKWDKSQ
jgi:hypothetical protein